MPKTPSAEAQIPAPPATRALRLSHPVGRQKEEQKIKQAINDGQRSRVIYMEGTGGIGKTMLLEEVHKWRGKCICTPIIDLYTVNTNSAVEQAIVGTLGETYFQRYLAARAHFQKRLENLSPEALATEGERLTRLFVKDFNSTARKKRIILRLDTVETVQFERAQIEKAYGIQPPEVELKTWLLRVIPHLENTVTILAGHPHPELSASLKGALKKGLEPIPLEALDEAGTFEYLKEMQLEAGKQSDTRLVADTLQQLSELQRRVIHIYTGGNPIFLALFVDWLTNFRTLPTEFTTDPNQALRQSEEDIMKVRDAVRRELVSKLSSNLKDPIPRALQYLGFARKGLDEELFKRIHGREWSQIAFGTLEGSLSRLSFVKIRRGHPRQFFLHDEMYLLFEQYGFLQFELRKPICDELIAFYEEQIAKEKDPSRINDLRVEQLCYELVRDPQEGLRKFLAWDEQAIREGLLGYDMRLRDEVSRFREKEEQRLRASRIEPIWIDRDATLRWIRRFYVAKDYSGALQFIAGLRSEKEKLFNQADPMPDLYEGIVKGQASLDLAATAELLQNNIPKLGTNGNPLQEWQFNLARAEAYNALGYALRVLKHYQGAIDAYNHALTYQRRLKLRAIEADTLNNLAYVYVLQGNPDWAFTLCEDGRKIREDELKHKYTTALSYNTLGLIHLFALEPENALEPCKKALRYAREAKSLRVEGMARNALGQVYRKVGGSPQISLAQAETYFSEAERMLKAAERIWKKLPEIPREVETYNELGCTYRDWGIRLIESGKSVQGAKRFLAKAEKYLQKSIRQVPNELLIERADALEDMAEVYAARGDRNGAFDLLQQAEDLIPGRYKISHPDIDKISDPINGYWLALAKVSQTRGELYFADDLAKSIHHYVFADAYFRRYSRLGNLVDRLSTRVIERIRNLEPSGRTKAYDYAKTTAAQYNLTNIRLVDALRALAGGGQ